ncbi:glycosyl hydrolase 53 [Corynespora cassiicola Philippines]|uniref:Arabinogalactan endo-beta-1,4-galactanase n=1 Tax=Corynespora cassiicola Philippines TaxID=1448308 RepID=A0A2T2NZM5_CORCC|nr:glycosyl hydrolase 53 [Corynespora cassiicola Philippines]
MAIPGIQAALTYRAMDWSSTLAEERRGEVFLNQQGEVQPLEDILVASGVNMVRQRVWTVNGDYGIDYNLELAKRAKAAGLMFGLNLHYSDTWTNPGLQDIPTGWPTDIGNLESTIYNYTSEVCNTFADAGLVPTTITIGNEINGGLLWPVGKYDQPANLAKLLHAASAAIRASTLDPPPKIQIHLSHGADLDNQQWFYDMIIAEGTFQLSDIDQQTVSHYPFWGEIATRANLKASLQNLVDRFDKEVMIVETNWPVGCAKRGSEVIFPPDTDDIPLTAEGQTMWVERTAETLGEISQAVGISYWEGAWFNNAVLGSPCEWNPMFDGNANPLSSLNVFQNI